MVYDVDYIRLQTTCKGHSERHIYRVHRLGASAQDPNVYSDIDDMTPLLLN